MLAAVVHLANRPDGAVLVVLVIAIVLAIVAGVVAFMDKAFWALLVCAALAFFFLAFLVT